MRTGELVRLVWQNITQNKFRTIMTSIGIIVGAATIVMVIAIGKGGQMDVADQFRNLNAGAIDISCDKEGAEGYFSGGSGNRTNSEGEPSGTRMQTEGESSGNGAAFEGELPGNGVSPEGNASGEGKHGGETPSGGEAFGGGVPEGMEMPGMGESGGFGAAEINQEKVILTEDDLENILTNITGITEGTLSYTTRASVDGGELEEETVYTMAGVESNYASISNLTLSAGEFLTEEENDNKEKACIMGSNAAEEIFGSAMDAYGSVLYIDQRIYVVDGVLEEIGSVASGISPDDAIFIPYETGIKYLVGENVNPTLTVISENIDDLDTVIASIKELLAETCPNTEFTYTDAGSKMEAASASNDILTMLLIAMAVIVFVVGGIGIMNVMFVSVKERTNEIGILKAIGCSRKNILLEFLMEAAAISLIGGILGICSSLLVTLIVKQLGIRVELSCLAFGAALLFAVGTGVLFGFYPALQASRLVPVDALNAE